MKKSDFIEHKPVYLETCEKIINDDRPCQSRGDLGCLNCPFNRENSPTKFCNYSGISPFFIDNRKKAAQEYLALFETEKVVTKPKPEENNLIYDRNIIIID